MFNPGMDDTEAKTIEAQQPGPPLYPQPGMIQTHPGMVPSQQQTGIPVQQPVAGYPPQPVYPSSHISNSNTTVVIQQPQTQVVIQRPITWSTGLCACCDDCGICFLGFCCPAIHSCVVSSKAEECCCVGMYCPIALRTKIRERHNIQGSIIEDYCTLAYCGPCAMCQMDREINLRGM